MTDRYTTEFLEILNAAIDYKGITFTPDTPIIHALKKGMCAHHIFLESIAHVVGIDVKRLNQGLIDPENDTVQQMMDRIVAHHAAR